MSDKITHYTPRNSAPPCGGAQPLEEWQASQPPNYFTADSDLQRKLESIMGRKNTLPPPPSV
ncbi:MAG: hypothetical protein IPL28_15400 [Chloroflexi bacterium]|nr:hypothetical protein [Chloroflexota bacterium]